jgi:hypothetical protein
MDEVRTPAHYSDQRAWHIKRAMTHKANKRKEVLAADMMSEYALWVGLENNLLILRNYLAAGSRADMLVTARKAQEAAAELRARGTQLQLGGF